jgi:hypothetical protein
MGDVRRELFEINPSLELILVGLSPIRGMNIHLIVKHAVQVISDAESSQKERDVATATLVAAAEEDLAGRDAASALWNYIVTNRSGSYTNRAACALSESLPMDSAVLSGAVTAVSSRETNQDLFEAALTVVMGRPYAAHVTPEVLVAISECSVMKGRRVAMFVPQLIEIVHDVSGGLPSEVLGALRDVWSRSRDEEQRSEAADIARLIPEMDLIWLDTMLRDPSSVVRVSTAQGIRRMPECEKTIPLIEERIGTERHGEVLASLHEARVDIMKGIERKARRRVKDEG